MNLAALPELLLAWMKSQAATPPQGERPGQTLPFKVGTEYGGKILDVLPNGRHLVQVAGQKLDMALPRQSQVGDSVRLTFLDAGPRPTFLLNPAPVAAVEPVRISQTAQQVGALLRVGQPAATAPTGTQNPHGSAAQATGQAAAQAAAGAGVRGMPGPPAVLPAAAAAAPMAAARIPHAAAAMPGTAGKVARAAAGPAAPQAAAQAAAQAQAVPASAAAVRPIVANVLILQTRAAVPLQMPLALASANHALQGQAVDGLRAALASGTSTRPGAIADPAAPGTGILPNRLAQTVRESGLFYESHLSRWVRGAYPFESLLNEPQARLGREAATSSRLAELGGMPEEAAHLAGRQLQMLEGAPFQWQGLAWPGQWLQWLIEQRQEGGDASPGEAQGAVWDTELRLTLPRMGELHARLSLRGGDVEVRLRVREIATAEILRESLPDLDAALRAAGLQPRQLAVAREDL